MYDHPSFQAFLNTGLIGLVAAMGGFLIKKWIGGLERKIAELDSQKMDTRLCLSQHKIIEEQFKNVTGKMDDFKYSLDEMKRDIKELIRRPQC